MSPQNVGTGTRLDITQSDVIVFATNCTKTRPLSKNTQNTQEYTIIHINAHKTHTHANTQKTQEYTIIYKIHKNIQKYTKTQLKKLQDRPAINECF